MKLEKYVDKSKKKRKIILISLGVIVLVSVSLLLYKTFASFTESAEFSIMNGKVDYFGNSDVYFVFYKNGALVDEMPEKDNKESIVFDHGECDNGASIIWNYEKWAPFVKDLKNRKTKCSLYFEKRYTEKILKGTDPVLDERLIPIKINEENGKVTRADKSEKWYSYSEQKWANAVILQNSYKGLKNSGIVNGAELKDGYVHFDGQDDYIDLGLEDYDFGNSFTYSIRSSITMRQGDHYLGNAEGAGFHFLNIGSENQLQFGIYMEGDSNYTRIDFPVTNPELFHTYTFRYDGNTINIYIDGVKQQAEYITNKKVKVSKAPIVVAGNLNFEPTKLYTAFGTEDVEQVVIYDKAIDEKEIQENFKERIKLTDTESLLRYEDFTNREYENNEIIPEDSIESYFVWIPRYRYEIFNEGNYEGLDIKEEKEQIINIEFENKDEEVKSGNSVGQWLTHPAFTAFNTNGIWVGKFETGYDGAGSTGAASVNPSIEASNKVIIKPNVYSWRGIQVAKAYTVGLNYKQTLNSHMMKNMEWGAIAYLQHSEYGSHANVRINNNSNYLTGYAARHEPTTGFTNTNILCTDSPDACNEYGGVTNPGDDGEFNTNYFNKASVVASTTANYSGVYDMSGGAWEYMMSGLDDNSTGDGKTGKLLDDQNSQYNAGFNDSSTEINLPSDERYYDKYDYSTSNTTYNRGKLGDATKEMGPFQTMKYETQSRNVGSWYNNEAWLIRLGAPWVTRGGAYSYGTGSGLFNFHIAGGNAIGSHSFRLVLAF